MRSYIGGGQDRPLIRIVLAVIFGVNSIEYKPIHLGYGISLGKRILKDWDKNVVFLSCYSF